MPNLGIGLGGNQPGAASFLPLAQETTAALAPCTSLARRRAVAGGATAAAAMLFILWRRAAARPLQVVETRPAANGTMDRGPAQYYVRFAGPVDHYRASLFITRGNEVVHRIHPRLNAAPEVLFGTAPGLEPGAYELHWSVTSLADGDVIEGSLPFVVRPEPN
jgi:methionine-rich copper-binding protein CopC